MPRVLKRRRPSWTSSVPPDVLSRDERSQARRGSGAPMIELSSSDSHISEPEASLGSIRYVISPVASFGLVDHECVEIQTREVRTRISLDAYRLIAEFRVPRTPAEVYSSADIQVSFR